MSVPLVDRTHFTRALSSRPFALLWIGQTLSSMGDGAFFTALAWQVLAITGSSAAMGIVVAAQTLPAIFFMLIGGVAADRLPRRLIMIWSDIGRAIAVLTITVLGWLHLLQLWHLIFLVILFGIADSFFRPAYRSISPELVEKDRLSSANALTGLSKQMNQLLGPIIGATLVAFIGPSGAFGFDGLTFIISVLFLLGVRSSLFTPVSANKEAAVKSVVSPKKGFLFLMENVREGLSYIVGSTWLWSGVLVSAGIGVVVTGALAIAMPKLVSDFYHSGVWLFGLISTALALGSISSIFVIGQLKTIRRRGIVLYGILTCSCLACAAFGIPGPTFIHPFIAVIAALLIGFGTGASQVIWPTLLQELVPLDKLGRVSSVDALGSVCLMPIGFIVIGNLVDLFGPAIIFICSGLIGAVFACSELFVKDVRQLE
ncbi:MFS transporter [Tengunoibacter tsumagoiensis]|uniref:Putative transporter n=1 Tax=Tengunoibacter tsumagoiensis TaxID=2014871 RepID=A0A402A9L2_9CHLR|nr:MFS transporter [Tengunoibacter tsumagoiensis]GCE15696.1 putative transporter [Tengunoibacter tsumagoiensis]